MKIENKPLAPYFVMAWASPTLNLHLPGTEDSQGKISRYLLYSDKEIYFSKKMAWVYPVIPHKSSLILVED